VTELDIKLLAPLAALLKANGRLNDAIEGTREFWAWGHPCWIDQITEPTLLLEHHKIGEVK
jgi:hypothetical protein